MPAAKSKRRAPAARIPEAAPRVAAIPFTRGPLAYAAVSVLVAVPCYWQARIQAGDLGSHIYNAWLVELIRSGQVHGLAVVPQTTNILFDVILSALFRAFGAAAAQRIAVSLAVLLLFWGAFAFCAAAGRKPWRLTPALGMLAYGWVFHMGFFNFYLSLGFCFWVLALAWRPGRGRMAAAALLLVPAYIAHPVPLLWTVAVLAYTRVLRRWPGHPRRLLLAAVVAMAALHVAFAFRLWTHWGPEQAGFAAGAQELWVFGRKYLLPAAALALVWLGLGAAMARAHGRAAFSSAISQVCAVTAAGILILPGAVWFPAYAHPVTFLAQRMSLPLAVSICALLSSAPASRWQGWTLAAAALLFFGFLYTDEGKLNRIEDQETALVQTLPPGQRVIAALIAPDVESNPLAHLVDRACVGRCYSYANYEPSSGQFRVRATGESGVVVPTDTESMQLQVGAYVVRPGDLPLYQIVPDASGHLALRTLPAGIRTGIALWEGL